MTRATDYDAPRKTDEEVSEDSIEELKNQRNDKNSGKVDEDEVEAAESFELPGADLSHEELTVRVLPRQSGEFTCASCFLVKGRSQLAEERNGQFYCVDCVCSLAQRIPPHWAGSVAVVMEEDQSSSSSLRFFPVAGLTALKFIHRLLTKRCMSN